MGTPELSILVLNLIIIVVSYRSIYPKLAGDDIKKISLLDVLSSAFALLVVGLKYWDTSYDFNLFIYNTNWFWFTLLSYFLIEAPFIFWYIKKYHLKP